jgi:hypothetical protein
MTTSAREQQQACGIILFSLFSFLYSLAYYSLAYAHDKRSSEFLTENNELQKVITIDRCYCNSRIIIELVLPNLYWWFSQATHTE